MDINVKPRAPTQAENDRQDHTALRVRMLTGRWDMDLEATLSEHLPPDRRESWGPSDMSSNPFEQVVRQLAVLYDQPPTVTNEAADISPLVSRSGLLNRAGLWSLMARAQQFIIGLRECIIRVDVTPPSVESAIEGSRLLYRIVTPDMVYCESDSNRPDEPTYYRELRVRKNPMTGKQEWVYDVIDLRHPSNPLFGLYYANNDGTLGEDVSELYMGTPALIGEAYPYRDREGRPFMPLVLYHAERTGALWDTYTGASGVWGSLSCGVLFSQFLALSRDSSWAQKYIVGLSVSGLTQEAQNDVSRRSSVTTDPSSILVFSQDPDANGQPLVGTFSPPVDPQAFLEAIVKYEYRIAQSSGIATDILRVSGDPRSGYALSVSKATQRESQKKFSVVQRTYDELLLAKTAMLCNRFLGLSLPESGYRVQYQSIPLSPEERASQRTDIIEKLNNGLISPIQAIQTLHPDLDEAEAIQYLERVRRERAQFLT